MLQIVQERKKVVILLILVGLAIAAILASYLVSRNSTDQRGKAATGSTATVSISPVGTFGAVGSEYKVNVMFAVGAAENVTAGAITVSYPTSNLTFDLAKTEEQGTNAGTACRQLNQTISVTESNGVVRLVKASYAEETLLPKGQFCFETLVFTVKSTTLTSSSEIKPSGSITSLVDWDIVGTAGRYSVVLGSGINLSGTGTTVTPLATSTVKPSSTPTVAPTTNIGTVKTSFPSTTVNVGAVGTEVALNVMLESASPVVGAGVTLSYPVDILEIDQTKTAKQSLNAPADCKKLDQDLDLYVVNGLAKLAKITYKAESELPTGVFCFGTFFFKVKTTTIPAGTQIKFAGDINDIKDWDIVSSKGRLTPVLGTAVTLKYVAPTATVKPSVTSVVTPTTAQCPRKSEGDANCDNKINLNDYEEFRTQYISFRRGQLPSSSVTTDFNDDGTVDIEDFAIFRESFIKDSFKTTPTP